MNTAPKLIVKYADINPRIVQGALIVPAKMRATAEKLLEDVRAGKTRNQNLIIKLKMRYRLGTYD